VRAERSAPTQVVGDGLTHIARQREPLQAKPFAANQHITGSPVEVVQLQPGQLPGAQPKPSQHGQDREVSDPDCSAAVTAAKELLQLAGVKRPR